ncbi:MAG: efflux RND transporter permease subunit [Shewanellaceae bacterium]|nr:efflux RND transporter permease subunit [Shewanellaceae bacterium]
MKSSKGLIAWFVYNPVAANLLMLFILIAGALSFQSLNRELIPSESTGNIAIDTTYEGVAAQDIEYNITRPIEEKLNGIDGIRYVTSISKQGVSSVTVHLDKRADEQLILADVEQAINGLTSLPKEADKTEVQLVKFKPTAMIVGLTSTGMPEPHQLLAKKLQDELAAVSGIGDVTLLGETAHEIAIEVEPAKLQAYGLTIAELVKIIKFNAKNISAGEMTTSTGRIAVRSEGQIMDAAAYEQLTVKVTPSGHSIRLGDVAEITDDFIEGVHLVKQNGLPALALHIDLYEGQDIIRVTDKVKQFFAQRVLPPEFKAEIFLDLAKPVRERLSTMTSNLLLGGILVFLLLAIFLEFKLACWVTLGLPVCFLGTVFLMSLSGVNISLNMYSMFAFILVLGIVVDDAIVIGESIHQVTSHRSLTHAAVIQGAKKVAVPATFGVLTTVAAFLPFLFLDNIAPNQIGFVVIACLLFSLVESKWILPSHLAHVKATPPSRHLLARWKRAFNQKFDYLISVQYRSAVTLAIEYRYAVLTGFLALIAVCAALLAYSIVPFIFQGDIESDSTQFEVEMNAMSSEEQTYQVLQQVERAFESVRAVQQQKHGADIVKNTLVRMSNTYQFKMRVALVGSDERQISIKEFENQWRAALPQLPGVKMSKFQSGWRADAPIELSLTATDTKQAQLATEMIKARLNAIDGVFDVRDNMASGHQEVQLELTSAGRALQLNLATVSKYVRQAVYGTTALTLLRGDEEVNVKVRYPYQRRASVASLHNIWIPVGNDLVPLSRVATIKVVDGMSQIHHEDGLQTIMVQANADKSKLQPLKVTRELIEVIQPLLAMQYPAVALKLGRANAEQVEELNDMQHLFLISVLLIYILMAIPLKSYTQPLIILSVIPLGFMGSILGHWCLGLPLSFLSLMGMLALAGVLVNDSLVLIDYLNEVRRQGESLKTALIDGGCYRFRAIFLTSVTTAAGLLPMLLETSIQGQILIPVAVSLAFGILFGTLVTLFFIPIFYMILMDIKVLLHRWWLPQPSQAST